MYKRNFYKSIRNQIEKWAKDMKRQVKGKL